MVKTPLFVIFLCLSVAAPTVQAKQHKEDRKQKLSSKKETKGNDDPLLNFRITTGEQEIIREYFRSVGGPPSGVPGPGKKKKNLPPGLRKKLARGGGLPPGWQRKVARGEVMDDEVFWYSQPLPPDLIEQLPKQPPGTIIITIEGKAVRLLEATRMIIDVLDI